MFLLHVCRVQLQSKQLLHQEAHQCPVFQNLPFPRCSSQQTTFLRLEMNEWMNEWWKDLLKMFWGAHWYIDTLSAWRGDVNLSDLNKRRLGVIHSYADDAHLYVVVPAGDSEASFNGLLDVWSPTTDTQSVLSQFSTTSTGHVNKWKKSWSHIKFSS